MIETIQAIAEQGLRDSEPGLDRHAVAPTTALERAVVARVALRAILNYVTRAQAKQEESSAGYHGWPVTLEVLSDHELVETIVPCEVE